MQERAESAVMPLSARFVLLDRRVLKSSVPGGLAKKEHEGV